MTWRRSPAASGTPARSYCCHGRQACKNRLPDGRVPLLVLREAATRGAEAHQRTARVHLRRVRDALQRHPRQGGGRGAAQDPFPRGRIPSRPRRYCVWPWTFTSANSPCISRSHRRSWISLRKPFPESRELNGVGPVGFRMDLGGMFPNPGLFSLGKPFPVFHERVSWTCLAVSIS